MRCGALCLAIILSVGGASVGGAAVAGEAYHMNTPFHATDFAAWNQSGDASLSGVVNYEDNEGIQRHCSGAQVELIPATPYNAEMVRAVRAASWRPVTGEDKAASRYVKHISCDKAGTFRFTNLPAGDWYVRTTLTWSQSWEYGVRHKTGELIRRVGLKPGINQVVLSDTDRVAEYTRAD